MLEILVFIVFILYLIPLAITIFTIIALWNILKKAGKEGWESIVPVYNIIVLLEITELPMWYIILFFIPFANIYATIKVYLELAYRFKQSVAFAIGLIFLSPIFLGILAFNKQIKYQSLNHFTTIFCSNCGTKINSNDKFCVSCGFEVDRPKDICLNCGNKIKRDDKFCAHCGIQI